MHNDKNWMTSPFTWSLRPAPKFLDPESIFFAHITHVYDMYSYKTIAKLQTSSTRTEQHSDNINHVNVIIPLLWLAQWLFVASGHLRTEHYTVSLVHIRNQKHCMRMNEMYL